jgi:hypothetical protein
MEFETGTSKFGLWDCNTTTGQQGIVMAFLSGDHKIIAIAENEGIVDVVVTPFCGGACIIPVMIAFVNSLRSAVAGGFAAGRRCGLQN